MEGVPSISPISRVKSFKCEHINEVFSIIISTSMSGYFFEKSERNLGRKYSPMVRLAPTFKVPFNELLLSLTSIYVMSSKFIISFALSYNLYPFSVINIVFCLTERFIKVTPKDLSKFFICVLTLGCDNFKYSPALVKFLYSTTAIKVFNSSSIIFSF